MQQSFIIGRAGNQPFEIEPSRLYVHSQHAQLVADTNSREWFIEDLKGNAGNGVYVRDDNGDFRRVIACRIRPTDVVRLGPESAQSFTFMAHKVFNPADYKYEFAYMRTLDERLRREENERVAINKKHNLYSILAPGVLAALTFGMRMFLEIDMGVTVGLCAVVTALPHTVIRYKYRNDADALKAIKSRRGKLIQCPKCWRPLSDYDLRNGRCSACKAM
ncbi:MAG: FHA domain-containing protein [Odoribacter sp.]|nr:FHA domain-containing protein [Odoribacter sp.]